MQKGLLFFLLRLGVRAASNSAYSGCPELWILRYPAHRYHAVPSLGFETTTLWLLRVRRPNHSATMLHKSVTTPGNDDAHAKRVTTPGNDDDEECILN
jgi:hypothetical protein